MVGYRNKTEMNMLNHKEMTKHLRHLIKREGVKARVKMNESCGSKYITVVAPAYGVEFSHDEQRKIRHIADCNRLTWVRGCKIDVVRTHHPKQSERVEDTVFIHDDRYRAVMPSPPTCKHCGITMPHPSSRATIKSDNTETLRNALERIAVLEAALLRAKGDLQFHLRSGPAAMTMEQADKATAWMDNALNPQKEST